MKKVLLFTSIFSVIGLTNSIAQTTKGKILVGISTAVNLGATGPDIMGLGYSTTTFKSDESGFHQSDADKTISFNLQPRVGYFIMDNLALGLDLTLATSSEKEGESGDTYNTTLFGVGPFARYYIPQGKFLPFVELGGSLGSLNRKYNPEIGSNSESKFGLSSIGGGVGLSAFLGDRVALDAMIGYNVTKIKDKENNDNNERTIIGTLGLKFGFTVLLGGN